MARIHVANVRSIDSAEIDLTGPILFLTGPNDGGKTSLARVIAGLAAGTGEIFDGNGRQVAQKVIAHGQKGAAAKLVDGKGERILRWSTSKGTHEVEETGDTSALPKGGVYATALASFLTMTPKERNAAFWKVVPVNPTRAQCNAWLKENGHAELIDDQWKEIERIGFDSAAESWAKSATAKAGEWAGITGEAFGPEKANGWQATVEASDKAAVDTAPLEKALNDAVAAHEEARAAEAKLPPLPETPGSKLTCPCCGEALMMRDGVLLAYEAPAADEVARIRDQRSKAQAATQTAREAMMAAERTLIEAQTRTRGRADDAKVKTERAAACFKSWKLLHALATMAGAKGARMAARDSVIDELNAEIAAIAASMGLGDPVEIVFEKVTGTRDDVVTMQVDGIPYDSLSGNRQWRARAILQIAIAKRTGADLVVMDEVEALDPSNRNRLFKALANVGLIAVVATYSPSIDKAPDLAAAGLGATYWIEGGKALPLAVAKVRPVEAAA